MKHVSILIPNGQFSIVNVAGALQLLEGANEMSLRRGGRKLFTLELVASENPARDIKGLYVVYPTKTLREIRKTDLIIVPPVHADLERVLDLNKDVAAWIRNKFQQGSEVACFCIGIYLLAEAGILNGKVCSTHWAHVDKLKLRFPRLNIRPENFVTDDRGVYTSGGAYSFTNLVLYLVEKFGSRDLAIQLSKAFLIDLDKGSQSEFQVFNGQKNHSDETILQIQEFIENRYSQKHSVDDLALSHSLIRRTLERRFRKATGTSINEYTQRVRVEAAKKELETGTKTINQVMYHVGYNDGKAFRDAFKKYVGIGPSEYREKFAARRIKIAKM
jgi:transcriptional regulator GlxA family with amidase domain